MNWGDNSESWIILKDLKESHPVKNSEFFKSRSIANEPYFVWWVPYTLRKRNIILSKFKAIIIKMSHKYGIKIQMIMKHANDIDRINNNTFWRYAISKDMTEVGLSFKVL